MTKRIPEPDPFNNPFGKVKLSTAQPPAKGPAAAPKPVARKEKPVQVDAEAAMFLEAMGEMTPVKAGKNRAPVVEPPRVDSVKVTQDESESLAQLAELVSGDGPFELVDSDSFLEGKVPGFDAQVMKRLRTGAFARRAELDLHGLNRDQARAALEKFITGARNEGQRCVLVITGRGLNSADQLPVLKANLQQWLTRGRLARHVLAFCSALPSDGGTGAAYVLLRR